MALRVVLLGRRGVVSGDVVGSEADEVRVCRPVEGDGPQCLELGAFVGVGDFDSSADDEHGPERIRRVGVVDSYADDVLACEAASCWAIATDQPG